MPTPDDVYGWRGQELRGTDEEKLGTIEEIYLDSETGQPEWALITTGLFGVAVPVDKATVKEAPKIDPDGQLSQREEAELYRHYGLQYGESQAGHGAPEGNATVGEHRSHDEDAAGTVGRDVSGPTTDDAMTRSEEELRVGTSERERGRVRLRKYVTTEQVQQTVPVQRERVRVEREPITDANRDAATSGPDISEEEHEVILREEEPVVEKRVVPRERVRLDKDTVTGEER